MIAPAARFAKNTNQCHDFQLPQKGLAKFRGIRGLKVFRETRKTWKSFFAEPSLGSRPENNQICEADSGVATRDMQPGRSSFAASTAIAQSAIYAPATAW